MCPECGSKNVVDLNKTGQDRFVIVFGGSSNKVCQDCNCQFLFVTPPVVLLLGTEGF